MAFVCRSRQEIRSGLLGMGLALTSSELESVMHAFDSDGRGIRYTDVRYRMHPALQSVTISTLLPAVLRGH